MRRLSFTRVLALLITILVLAPASSVLAQAAQHDHQQQAAQKGGMKMDGMKMDHQANTERVATLMAQVKSSTGDAKVAAMADLIGVLVEERAAMQEHCAAMMAMMKK